MKTITEIFAENLRASMVEKGISVQKLCKELSLPESSVYHWLRGKREPSLLALVALSQYFGLSTDYLLGLED